MSMGSKKIRMKFWLCCGHSLDLQVDDVDEILKNINECRESKSFLIINYDDGINRLINLEQVSVIELFSVDTEKKGVPDEQ